jgi:rod shape-determining protein MreD
VKAALYAGLLVGLVPLQATWLPHAAIGGVRPDVCLIAVTLTGLLAGEVQGMLLGLALGFLQDLFSAGQFGLNLLTKGAIGFLAGLAGRRLGSSGLGSVLLAMLLLSLSSGTVFLSASRGGRDLSEILHSVGFVLLPETALNLTVAAALYWLLAGRIGRGRLFDDAGAFGGLR